MRKMLLVLLAVSACKKKQVDDVEGPVRIQNPVEVTVQIVTVSPGTVSSGREAKVTVVGSGFQQGASVKIGEQLAPTTFKNPNQLEVVVGSMVPGQYDVRVDNPDLTSAFLSQGLSVRAAEALAGMVAWESCRHTVLYYDTDAAGLSAENRSAIDAILPCLQQSGVPIRVEGHADERGTTDYNVSLAQRRAKGVADILVAGGIARNRLVITSYGEERPLDRGFGETSWAKNRRVEINLE